eukprot:7067553-Prymnesium_polylepis.1
MGRARRPLAAPDANKRAVVHASSESAGAHTAPTLRRYRVAHPSVTTLGPAATLDERVEETTHDHEVSRALVMCRASPASFSCSPWLACRLRLCFQASLSLSRSS